MTSTGETDEMLRINSPRAWLVLIAMLIVSAGMITWGVLGRISHNVRGFGIIKTQELPREIVANCTGQVDSIFCRTGDNVKAGQCLIKLFRVEQKVCSYLLSPFDGEVTGAVVREGTYVNTGDALLEVMRNNALNDIRPEVVFFVDTREVSSLKKGMSVSFEINKSGLPAGLLKGVINFIADKPVSKVAIQKYFPGQLPLKESGVVEYHEVRTLLVIGSGLLASQEKALLHSINGLTCRAIVNISRKAPVEYLFNRSL